MLSISKKKKVKPTPLKSSLQQRKDKEKSKSRSISVSKSKNKNRMHTKSDLAQQNCISAKNKAFLSVNQDVNVAISSKINFRSVYHENQKQHIRRTPNRNKISSSRSQLVKPDPNKIDLKNKSDKKRKSAINPKPKHKTIKQVSSTMRKPKLQGSIQSLQKLELANRQELMNVTSSEQIVFSSRRASDRDFTPIKIDKRRNEIQKPKRGIAKQEKQEKAVIMIQKVWRGYQTRKILDKFLKQRIRNYQIQSSPSNQFEQDFAPLKRSENKANNSISFNTAKISFDDVGLPSEIKSLSSPPPNFQQIFQPNPLDNALLMSEEGYGSDSSSSGSFDEDQGAYLVYQQQQKNKDSQVKNLHVEKVEENAESSGKSNRMQQPVRFHMSVNEVGSNQKDKNAEQPFQNKPTEERIETTSTKQDYKNKVIELKRQQIEKWNTIANMIKEKTKNGLNKNFGSLLDRILEQSLANKKNLEDVKQDHVESLDTRITTNEQQISSKRQYPESNEQNIIYQESLNEKSNTPNKNNYQKSDSINELKNLLRLSKEMKKPQLKSNGLIEFEHVHNPSPANMAINKITLKQSFKDILQKKLLNLSSRNLNDIISIREEMLKQRKKRQQEKLNKLLYENKIGLQQFQEKNINLADYIQNQKIQIERAKRDIEKGLRVATEIAIKTQRDARWLGRSTGLSKSSQQLKIMPKLLIPFSPRDHFMKVDELYKRNRQINFFGDSSGQNSEQPSLTEEQIIKYKSPRNLNLQFNDMNRNIMVEEFLQAQKSQQSRTYNSNSISNKKYLEEPTDEEAKAAEKNLAKELFSSPKKKTLFQSTNKAKGEPEPPNKRAEAISIYEDIIQSLLLEFSFEILKHPCLFETVSRKLHLPIPQPKPVSLPQTLTFVSLVESFLPPQATLLTLLNQQISPPPIELLKCMRVDFYEEEQEVEEEEIGKFEFVIPQEACTKAVKLMVEKQDKEEKEGKLKDKQEKLEVKKEEKKGNKLKIEELPEEMREVVQKRQKLWERRLQNNKQRRAQVFKIQMHCIFDCWNQQILALRSCLPGFSGIGLNQPTLSLQDHNKPITLPQVPQYLHNSKQKLLQMLTDDRPATEKISSTCYQQMCQNESAWICYTDESLGFLLELDYLIGQELMAEVARFLFKKLIRQSLFPR